MSQFILRRLIKGEGFTSLPNHLHRDQRASWGARGLLGFMLAHPPTFRMNIAYLVKQSPGGEHNLRTLVDELKSLGYVKIVQPRDKSGCIAQSIWLVTSFPGDFGELGRCQSDSPCGYKPDIDDPDAVRPDADNRALINIDSKKELKSINDGGEKKGPPSTDTTGNQSPKTKNRLARRKTETQDGESKVENCWDLDITDGALSFVPAQQKGLALEAPPSSGSPPSSADLTDRSWNAYVRAFSEVEKCEPRPGTRSKMARVIDSFGDDAPGVLAFYCRHPKVFYMDRGHSIDVLLQDADQIYAEFKRGEARVPQYGVKKIGHRATAGLHTDLDKKDLTKGVLLNGRF